MSFFLDKNTKLLYASDKGNLNEVKRLLKKGADVNTINEYTVTPLMAASMKGHLEIVKELLSNGADIEFKENTEGRTSLLLAVQYDRINVVKELISRGANISVKSKKNGFTPLILASANNKVEIAKLLLSNGAAVNALGKGKITSLMYACKNGNVEIVKLLISNRADVNITSDEQQTALEYFIYDFIIRSKEHNKPRKIIEIITELLSNGAKLPSKKDIESISIYYKDDRNFLNKILKIFEIFTVKNTKTNDLWKGWTQSDADNLNSIFEEYANKYSCCPVCLKYVELSEACNYMKHDCSIEGGFYHLNLYAKYKTADGFVSWCTICGRVSRGHRHYKLGYAKGDVPKLEEGFSEPFTDDCSKDGSGGGGLKEKLARFRRLREYALELQDYVGKKNEIEAMEELTEETWNSPLIRDNKRLKKIMANKKFNISSNEFPIGFSNAEVNTVEALNNAEPPNINKPAENKDLQPTIIEGTDFITGEEGEVIQFHHRQPDGTIYHHENSYISAEMLQEWALNITKKDFGLPKFGLCWAHPECKGKLYPEDLKEFVSEELYNDYLRKFNRKFQGTEGGGLRKTKKIKKNRRRKSHRGGGTKINIFVPADTAVCSISSKNM